MAEPNDFSGFNQPIREILAKNQVGQAKKDKADINNRY
jgi:hypothetical protein